MEKWLSIPGFIGIYEASNFGRVRSINRLIIDKNNKLKFITGKILKSSHKDNGYLFVNLHDNNSSRCLYVHRLVLCAFTHQPLNTKLQANHIDGNKTNNNINNLEWVTCSENKLHAQKIGLRDDRGENNPSAKLSEEQVKDIIKRLENHETNQSIASIYRITYEHVNRIKNGDRWQHIMINKNKILSGPAHGARSGVAKLNDEKVKIIKQQKIDGISIAQIARNFKVTEGTIHAIIKNRTWRHVL